MKYKAVKVYTYTETVLIDEADSVSEARELAYSLDGERNNDESLYDVVVYELKDN